ncbi:MAG TPA: 30S ribosomal protein S2 [Candidatus Paceibacterota bacterium]|nr:30S ribosomal protein S2 [Candidatus Paceibacterota bacterium]
MQSLDTNTTQNTTQKTLIERLFSVGAHFGFTRSRRHPTATPYIFANKQGTDIIDLEQTAMLIENASHIMSELGRQGKAILLVGTKEEIKRIVTTHAQSAEIPYVTNRWVGGMLTNFSEIRKRVARLNDLIIQGESGELERKYTKKERVIIGRELTKLTQNFGGIQKMERTPSALIVVDPRHDAIAVSEARELNIPVVALANSDTNLTNIQYPIMMNDGLQSSVSLVLEELISAYVKGKSEYVAPKREDTRRRDR